jgi:hypothetical protein
VKPSSAVRLARLPYVTVADTVPVWRRQGKASRIKALTLLFGVRGRANHCFKPTGCYNPLNPGEPMSHSFSINDDVHHQGQGPQGRAEKIRSDVYTVIGCMPIEADGRLRYRIRSKTENVERIVTEEQLSRSQ